MSIELQRNKLIDLIAKMARKDFDTIAMEVFHFQAIHNEVYAKFLALLSIQHESIHNLREIPFLPIELFKKNKIQTGVWEPAVEFKDSKGNENREGHYLRNANWYRYNSRRCFNFFYGNLKDYCVLALLPSYLDRSGSSLIFMVDDFIQQSDFAQSGFFIKDTSRLRKVIQMLSKEKTQSILIGDSTDLVDFAEKFPGDYGALTVMETRNTKNQLKKTDREGLHQKLRKLYNIAEIHSEYGLDECLSQAYSKSNGLFSSPPTMRLYCRHLDDPLAHLNQSMKRGYLNLIDLANLDSCSFIATNDIGQYVDKNRFEVFGTDRLP